MKKNVLFLILTCFFLLLTIKSVMAIGVGVKPKELNIKTEIGKAAAEEILIINPSDEPAFYSVSADNLKRKIAISPVDFLLEPNSSRIAVVIVKSWIPCKFNDNISVVSRPVNHTGLTAASGVKVPIVITAMDIPFWWIILEIVIGSCLIIFFMVKLRKKRNNKIIK